MGERKMWCYIDTAFQTAPPGNSSYLTERTWRTSKAPADPLAFLLAALVSNHLQLPRTPRTSRRAISNHFHKETRQAP